MPGQGPGGSEASMSWWGLEAGARSGQPGRGGRERPVRGRQLTRVAAAAWLVAASWVMPFPARAGYNWMGVLQSVAARQDPEALLFQAAAYLNLGRVAQALQAIDRLARLPAHELVAPVMGHCEEKLRQEPDDLAALHCLAVGYYALDQVEPALNQMRRIVALDPGNPWPLNLMALAQMRVNDVQGALASARSALQLDRSNQYTHLILSQIYLHQRDYLRSLIHLFQAPDAAREMQEYLRRQHSAAR